MHFYLVFDTGRPYPLLSPINVRAKLWARRRRSRFMRGTRPSSRPGACNNCGAHGLRPRGETVG